MDIGRHIFKLFENLVAFIPFPRNAFFFLVLVFPNNMKKVFVETKSKFQILHDAVKFHKLLFSHHKIPNKLIV